MSSIKRKDEIQKSVEESILDAVTKFKKDEPAIDPYDGSRQLNEADVFTSDKTAQSLWDLAKDGLPAKNSGGSPDFNGFDAKTFVDPNRNSTIVGKSGFKSKKRGSSESEVRTEVFGKKEPAPTFGSVAPSVDFGSSDLAKLNAVQLKLYEGDHLKIAQQRIEDLERECDRLRLENERLASASNLFQKRSEENLALKQEIERKLAYSEERFSEERQTLKTHLEQRDQIIKDLRQKVEELESRLSGDIRKSRSRERELENRLELARLEKISLVGSKDEIILDLKRQIDQLNHELSSYRKRVADMNQTIDANEEQFRRTVRALRLALTNLEVNEQIGVRSKKAE